MDSLIKGIVYRRKPVFIVIIIMSLISALAYFQVGVNYDLVSYLPQDQPSTAAVAELTENFGTALPNARIAIPAENVREALLLKEELQAVEGVTDVIWLDDTLDLSIPLELADQATVEGFYFGGEALFQVTGDTDNSAEVVQRLTETFPDAYVAGNLVDLASAQNSVIEEVTRIALFVIPIVAVILLLSTHSWLEPLIFLITIGIAILLNMGSNIIFGEISFLTQAVAAILQLAVSMDYAIFLLHRFNDFRAEGLDPEQAMIAALRQSLPAIFSSSITTVAGFLALVFMRFGLGADLGFVMAKGILLAFLTVMIFMPTLILLSHKWVERASHRPFLPDLTKLGRFVTRARGAILVLVILIAIPSFLASRSNEYIYGMGVYPPASKAQADREHINEQFGQQVQLAMMVPQGDVPAELTLENGLQELPSVINVMSYNSAVNPAIPPEVIDDDQLDMLVSDNYKMFIITAEGEAEGPEPFALVEAVRKLAADRYGDGYYLAGEPASMLDMKNTIEADDIIVNGLAIMAIALTIMFVYRSLTLPVLLVLTIEIAIWINLSIPYFTGTPLSYIGYLIVSTVQLGATVDYAILYTQHYLDNRATHLKKEAVVQASRQAIPSILPPAVILTTVGFVLGIVSSQTIVQDLGILLGRGAILSFLLVSLFLPVLLMLFDRLIGKTSLGMRFIQADSRDTGPETDPEILVANTTDDHAKEL